MKTSLFILSTTLTTSTLSTLLHCTGDCLRETEPYSSPRMYGVMEEKKLYWAKEHKEGVIGITKSTGSYECINGNAGGYPCSGIDLLSFTSLSDLGSKGQGNDIWGWTDSENNEYVIAGCSDGSSFVDVTNPANPVVLGFLPTQTVSSSWRDMKVYEGYVYIGSEAKDHGLQVFDLHQLTALSKAYRSSNSTVHSVATFAPTLVYTEFGSSHNIVINEQSGYLYSVGSKTCAGGLHIVDIREPANPKFAGCYSDDGYTHDAECVIYKGPDTRYTGNEICFNYNEDTLTIVDVTHKDAIKLLARYGYAGSQYTHQGWLNAEQSHLLMDDELDEQKEASLDGHTRTLIWDVSTLDIPTLVGNFYSSEQSIDHNQYIHNGYSYQSNYCAGLRVLDTSGMTSGTLSEKGYFDVAPDCNKAVFSGTWSNYPYFKSGTIAVQSIEKGLFLVKTQF